MQENVMAREITSQEGYQDKLVKLIPTEIIGAYLFISTGILGLNPAAPAIPQDAETKAWILIVSMTLLILTPLYLLRLSGVTNVMQLLVTTVSFLVWVYSLGGPFVVWDWGYSPKIAGSVLVLWSLITPLLVQGHTPPPGTAGEAQSKE
jgi:hypothetical protein